MRFVFSVVVLLASLCAGARVTWHTAEWGVSLQTLVDRAADATAVAERATDTYQRWLAVRQSITDTVAASDKAGAAVLELGRTLQSIDAKIDENGLRPLLDGEISASDLGALKNTNALHGIIQEFVATSDELMQLAELSEALVGTVVAVLDLTDSVPELAGVWSGIDVAHLREVVARASSVSSRLSDQAAKLKQVEEQLKPLDHWDDLGRWGKARVLATNFNSLRSGLTSLSKSYNSIRELHEEEASTIAEVTSNIRAMQSAANHFTVR